MRAWLLALSVLLGVSQGACLSERNSRGDGILVNLEWTCPPEATELLVQAFPVGANGSLNDIISCAERQPAGILYDAGDYDLYVTPRGPGRTFVSDYELVDGYDGDVFNLAFDFLADEGYLAVEWTINGSDASAACEQVEAGGVSVVAAVVGGDGTVEDIFECSQGQGVTAGLALGDYRVELFVLDGDDQPLGMSEAAAELSLEYGSQLLDLGTIDLLVPEAVR